MSINWTAVAPLALGGTSIKSNFAPGITGFNSKIFCAWAEDGSDVLVYAISSAKEADTIVTDPTAFWDSRAWSSKVNVGFEKQTISARPALEVLDGVIHLVVPDKNKNLVHYQYVDDPTGAYWRYRCGLAALSADSVGLATFRGRLHCVYKDASTNKLCMVRWDPRFGWSPAQSAGVEFFRAVPEVKGDIALVELNGLLQVIATTVVAGAPTKGEAKGFTSKDGLSWTAMDATTLNTGILSTYGVSAACYNSNAFLCYSSENDVWTKHYATNKWQANERQKNTKSSKTPGITILDNIVLCIWPNDVGILQQMTRKAWALPPLNAWMTAIDDATLLSDLTIPGAHDAAAMTDFIFARTHTMSITQQLQQGIRYFDLRGSYKWFLSIYYELNDPDHFSDEDDPVPYAVHGDVPIYRYIAGTRKQPAKAIPMSIESIFQEFYNFLKKDANKKETIIVQIKQDAGSDDPKYATKFSKDIQDLIIKNKNQWRTESSVPKMEQLRGKIQLVRRFALPAKTTELGIDVWGPDGKAWKNSTTFPIPATGAAKFQIQDVWQYIGSSIESIAPGKFEVIKKHLEKAANDTAKDVLYFNFCSANGLPFAGPELIAQGGTVPSLMDDGTPSWEQMYIEGINKRLDTYFNDVAKVGIRYGVVLMDFPEDPEELITGLIKSNASKFKGV